MPPGFISKLDDVIAQLPRAAGPARRLDEAGPLLRKLIGELADEPSVYQHHSTLEEGEPLNYKPGFSLMQSTTPRSQMPPAGTEIGLVSPVRLIEQAVYPDDLRKAALSRLGVGGAGQDAGLAYDSMAVPLYVRPTESISPYQEGRRVALVYPGRRPDQFLDVAGLGQNALRTLIHEARHATQGYDLDTAPRSLRSISSYRPSGIDGRTLNAQGRRYFGQPAELLAWMGGAGDDFVRSKGRLVEGLRDANAVIEMLEAGEASPEMIPLARQLYVEAYRNNKTAREHINNVLTRYFSIPVAAGAGASMTGDDNGSP